MTTFNEDGRPLSTIRMADDIAAWLRDELSRVIGPALHKSNEP